MWARQQPHTMLQARYASRPVSDIIPSMSVQTASDRLLLVYDVSITMPSTAANAMASICKYMRCCWCHIQASLTT